MSVAMLCLALSQYLTFLSNYIWHYKNSCAPWISVCTVAAAQHL